MIKKKFAIIAICVIVFSFVFWGNFDNAFADGGGWIGQGTGTGSSWNYDPSNPYYQNECPGMDSYRALAYCAGLSWIYYEAVTPTTEWIDFVPFRWVGTDSAGATKASISPECSNNGNGGFWHLGVNVQADRSGSVPSSVSWNEDKFTMEPYSWGHWTSFTSNLAGKYTPYLIPGEGGSSVHWSSWSSGYTWNWNMGVVGQKIINKNTREVYYSAKKSTTSFAEVFSDYKKAYERKYGAGSVERHGVTGIDGKVWAFCYWEDSYYGSSTGWATSEGGDALIDEKTTDIVEMDAEKIVDSDIVRLSDAEVVVNLNYEHNVYAEESGHEAWWRVSEVWFDAEKSTGPSDGFEILNNVPVSSSNVKFGNDKEGNYYIPDGNPVSNPVANDVVPVKLKKGGIYTFCQDLRIAETEDKMGDAKVTSEVCIKVNVVSGYYGMTKVGIVEGGEVTTQSKTDVVPMNYGASAPEIKITKYVGFAGPSSLTLKFSHNIYADSEGGNVFWGTSRSDDLVAKSYNSVPRFFTPGEALTFKSSTVTISNSVIGTKTLFKHRTVSTAACALYPDQCYYEIDPINGGLIPNYHNINMGDYVNEHSVMVSFSGEDEGEYRFCERLYMDEDENTVNRMLGGNSFTSEACVVVKVVVVEAVDQEDFTYVWSTMLNASLKGRLEILGKDGPFGEWRGVRNDYKENEATNVTYARPNDDILWVDYYNPAAQKNYGKNVVYVNDVEVGAHGSEDFCGPTSHIYKSFGGPGAGGWNNNFSIKATYPGGIDEYHDELSLGHSSLVSVDHNYKIDTSDVGKAYDDLIRTEDNTPHSSRYKVESSSEAHSYTATCTCWNSTTEHYVDCPKTFKHSNPLAWGWFTSSETIEDPENKQLQSKTFLKIPYNFKNESGFKMDRTETEHEPVYSGETMVVSGTFVTVGTKENSVVESTYATKVDGARVVLIAYVSEENQVSEGEAAVTTVASADGGSDNLCSFVDVVYDVDLFCKTVNQAAGTLTVPNDMIDSGITHGNNDDGTIMGTAFNGTYDVFDARAGDWFCMTLGVYPATSGGDKNLDPKGDNSWLLYTPKCIQIAKKPSFQVWGSGLYSAATGVSVSTNYSEKNNIYKVYDYTPKSNNATIFGSWVEENVTALGSVQWLASGAGLGKNDKVTKGGVIVPL